MQQFAIYYKRGTGNDFARLNPNDHGKLVDHEEIQGAVKVMRQQPCIEGVCLRLDDELFNILSFTQDAIAPNTFTFADETP